MHSVRSETSAGQGLSGNDRLRNVFIVLGALASIILASHILMRCRNKIPLLKRPNAFRRPSTRTNVNLSPLPSAGLKKTATLSRAELDTVAPKLFPGPAALQKASALEIPCSGDSLVPAPKAPVVTTRQSSTKGPLSPTVRKARSNSSASSTTTITTTTTFSPVSEPANATIKHPHHLLLNSGSLGDSIISTDESKPTLIASSPDPSSCSICLDFLFTDPQPTIRVITACGHAFHSRCLQMWLQRYQPRCPLCQRWLAGRSNNDDANDDVIDVDVVDRHSQDRSAGDGGARAAEEGRAGGEPRRTRIRWHARWF